MLYLSKSKYCGIWQCPKIAWMKKYKPEELHLDEKAMERFENGNMIGDLAMGIFGDYTEVTAYDGDEIDISKMLENTKIEIEKGTEIICEASFQYNGLYCAVDILKMDNGGWSIYEVKSSTHDEKAVYMADMAYQKYVLENCGINVTGTYIITINNKYVLDGDLDIHKLFKITDVSNKLDDETAKIASNLLVAETLLKDTAEPDIEIHKNCQDPYKCGFWEYCSRHLPTPSVFDLRGIGFKKGIEYYSNGIVSYEDFLNSGKLNKKTKTAPKQARQIDHYLNEQKDYIDKDEIKGFLDTLSYPIYFLDFESMQPPIPLFDGTKPYQQIPFQYSLHYIEEQGGELKHKEFLAVSGKDPRRALAERLCEDIPKGVCVTAYNKGFECTRIKELAQAFPDLAEHLLEIEGNIKDFEDPFKRGHYYNKAMAGRSSIKYVLPALFPNEPTLNYHNLDGVQNGTEAMSTFPKIKDMPPDEQEKARYNLLKYCELDTLAMVKVWEKLSEVIK